jgi:hypothetical protein
LIEYRLYLPPDRLHPPAVIVAFAICFIEYFIRWAKHAPIRSGSSRGEMTGKLLTMLGAVLLVTLFLFIR